MLESDLIIGQKVIPIYRGCKLKSIGIIKSVVRGDFLNPLKIVVRWDHGKTAIYRKLSSLELFKEPPPSLPCSDCGCYNKITVKVCWFCKKDLQCSEAK